MATELAAARALTYAAAAAEHTKRRRPPRRPGQGLRLRSRQPRLPGEPPDPRRQRLPRRLRDLPPLPRRARHHDLRGHQRDAAAGDRAASAGAVRRPPFPPPAPPSSPTDGRGTFGGGLQSVVSRSRPVGKRPRRRVSLPCGVGVAVTRAGGPPGAVFSGVNPPQQANTATDGGRPPSCSSPRWPSPGPRETARLGRSGPGCRPRRPGCRPPRERAPGRGREAAASRRGAGPPLRRLQGPLRRGAPEQQRQLSSISPRPRWRSSRRRRRGISNAASRRSASW